MRVRTHDGKEPKEIEIKTVEDFINAATEENYERLMHDFLIFCNSCMHVRKNHPDVVIKSMLWTDDGKNELTGLIVNGDKIVFSKTK